MLPDFLTLIRQPQQFLALGFGSGLSPFAPGTFGTLAAIPLYLAIALLPLWGQVVVIVLAFILGVYLCQTTADAFGVHDHPAIVWDEFVGLWITMLVLPIMNQSLTWLWLVLGFVLFRVFDIVKPWPISWIDSAVEGGLGIMLDDVIAGIFAAICLAVLIVIIP